MNEVINTLNAPRRRGDYVYFLTCFLYSIINFAFCSLLYVYIFDNFNKNSTLYWVLLIGVTLIVCLLLSALIGFTQQKFLLYKFLDKIGAKPIHPIPSSWDYIFSELGTTLIKVNLLDGKSFVGYYSRKSFASSDIEERDLYLEIKCLVKDGKLYSDESIKGVYITHGSIKTIEIIDEEKTNEQQQQIEQQSDKREQRLSTIPTHKTHKQRIPTKRKRFKCSTAAAKIRHHRKIKKKQRKVRIFYMDNKPVSANDNYYGIEQNDSLQHGYQPSVSASSPPPPSPPPTITTVSSPTPQTNEEK